MAIALEDLERPPIIADPGQEEIAAALQPRSLEHDTVWELHSDEVLEEDKSRLRYALGRVAVAGKVALKAGVAVAKKGVELAGVGAVGAFAGLGLFGVPVEAGLLHGTAKLTLNETVSLATGGHGDSEASALSFPSPLPVLGTTVTFDNAPLEITKNSIVFSKLSSAEQTTLSNSFTNYDQYIERDIDNAESFAMLYGFLAIAGYLGIRIAHQENKDKDWSRGISSKQLGKIALIAGISYLSVSPATMVDTKPVNGMELNSEFSAAPQGMIASGGFVDFIKTRRSYFDDMSKEQTKALKHISPLFDDENVFTMLVFEGSGCDTYVTRLNGEAADQLSPDLVLDLGDLGFGGTAVDEWCSEDSGEQLKGHPTVRYRGNHDPEHGFQAKWITYVEGKPVVKSGIRFNGGPDPNITETGKNTQKRLGKKNRSQTAAALAKETCKDQQSHPEDLIVFGSNQPSLAKDVVAQQCATLVFGGGTEAATDVFLASHGKVIQYQVPRSNGVKLTDSPTYNLGGIESRLPGEGQITLVGVNMRTGDVFSQPIIRHRGGTVTVHPDDLQYESQVFVPKPAT